MICRWLIAVEQKQDFGIWTDLNKIRLIADKGCVLKMFIFHRLQTTTTHKARMEQNNLVEIIGTSI
jgi:hypothetical protein